jgi:hypothetical protein
MYAFDLAWPSRYTSRVMMKFGPKDDSRHKSANCRGTKLAPSDCTHRAPRPKFPEGTRERRNCFTRSAKCGTLARLAGIRLERLGGAVVDQASQKRASSREPARSVHCVGKITASCLWRRRSYGFRSPAVLCHLCQSCGAPAFWPRVTCTKCGIISAMPCRIRGSTRAASPGNGGESREAVSTPSSSSMSNALLD